MICNADYYDSVEQTPRTGWKAYLPTAVRYILALVLLVVLDAFWMGLIAPLLGIKYFEIVEGIQVTFCAFWKAQQGRQPFDSNVTA